MSEADETLQLTGLPPATNWFIFNIGQMGYYRVNYNSENWQFIIDQLLADHSIVDRKNRAQLVDDAFTLARSGRLDYDTALGINAYMKNELEYVPWYASLLSMDYLERMFTRTPGYGMLKVMI